MLHLWVCELSNLIGKNIWKPMLQLEKPFLSGDIINISTHKNIQNTEANFYHCALLGSALTCKQWSTLYQLPRSDLHAICYTSLSILSKIKIKFKIKFLTMNGNYWRFSFISNIFQLSSRTGKLLFHIAGPK